MGSPSSGALGKTSILFVSSEDLLKVRPTPTRARILSRVLGHFKPQYDLHPRPAISHLCADSQRRRYYRSSSPVELVKAVRLSKKVIPVFLEDAPMTGDFLGASDKKRKQAATLRATVVLADAFLDFRGDDAAEFESNAEKLSDAIKRLLCAPEE